MGYYEVPINAAPMGFGEYQADRDGGDIYEEITDLLQSIYDSPLNQGVFELGVDDLPEEIEDIRGKVHNEPEYIYGYLDEQGITQYFGIRETE